MSREWDQANNHRIICIQRTTPITMAGNNHQPLGIGTSTKIRESIRRSAIGSGPALEASSSSNR